MPSSTCISAHKVPSSEQEIRESFVLVDWTDQCFLHRIVAIDTYYGSETGRFDTVILEADQEPNLENTDLNKNVSLVWTDTCIYSKLIVAQMIEKHVRFIAIKVA